MKNPSAGLSLKTPFIKNAKSHPPITIPENVVNIVNIPTKCLAGHTVNVESNNTN
jgi:hypothetical protein